MNGSDNSREYFVAFAFSPNPNRPPFFADFPFELVGGELKRIDAVWQKWITHDLAAMINSHQANLKKLRAIRFDCGTSDTSLESSRVFARPLIEVGVPHVFEEYSGDHTNRIMERMETKVLPFFSDALVFEMLPVGTAVQPRGKQRRGEKSNGIGNRLESENNHERHERKRKTRKSWFPFVVFALFRVFRGHFCLQNTDC